MTRASLSKSTRAAILISLLCLFPLAAVTAQTPEVMALYRQANRASELGDRAEAIRLASEALERDAGFAPAYRLRGREQFRQGAIERSIADLDRFVELRPNEESSQWERGIALYYAGQYERGAKQFELYQTYHSNDVENSVWRFLCMAPGEGAAQARAAMLPIQADPRVPMMQIYDLYRGRLSPTAVLAAAKSGPATTEQTAGRLFYAHLYLGLYYEVLGERSAAGRYIRLAAAAELEENRHINRYMWDVARIHAQRLPQLRPELGRRGL